MVIGVPSDLTGFLDSPRERIADLGCAHAHFRLPAWVCFGLMSARGIQNNNLVFFDFHLHNCIGELFIGELFIYCVVTCQF